MNIISLDNLTCRGIVLLGKIATKLIMLGGSGRCWEAQGDVGRLREMLGGSGRCWEAQRDVGRLREILAGSGRYWEAQ